MADLARLRAVLLTASMLAVITAVAPTAPAAAAVPHAAATAADCSASIPFAAGQTGFAPGEGESLRVTFAWTAVLPSNCDAEVVIALSTIDPSSGATTAQPPVTAPAAPGSDTVELRAGQYSFQARLVVGGTAGSWTAAQQFTVIPLDFCMFWVRPPAGSPVTGQSLDATSARLSVDLGAQDPLHLKLCGTPAVTATALQDPTAPLVSFPPAASTTVVTGLTPGRTYRWQVRAGDGTVVGTVTVTQPPAPGACQAELQVGTGWSNYHVVNATVTNTAATPLTGWRVSWPTRGTVTQLWNGVLDGASGTQVTTVANAPYNAAVGSGQTTTFGFIVAGGDWSQPNATGLICTPST
jgi:hypothetical protein